MHVVEGTAFSSFCLKTLPFAQRFVCVWICICSNGRQVITEYDDDTLPGVLSAVERMSQHLTAAVVSNDRLFQQKVGPLIFITLS